MFWWLAGGQFVLVDALDALFWPIDGGVLTIDRPVRRRRWWDLDHRPRAGNLPTT